MIIQATKTVNNILIVDDDPDILKYLVDLFQDQINVSFAPSGIKALEHLKTHKVDLVLLDVAMPEMDGFEVCRQLKSDPATKHIPVIFLTALTDNKDIAEGLRLGAVDYITKPINSQIIIAKVKNQLAHLTPLPTKEIDRPETGRDRRGQAAPVQERRGERQPVQRATAPAGSGRRGNASVDTGKGIPQRTIIMAILALLVVGGGAFLGMKFYAAVPLETSVDANWPFSSKCEQSPFASWWGTSTHASMVAYVARHHAGNWNPYIDKWVNQLNKMEDIDSRNGRASTSDGTVLTGKTLKAHIVKLKKRISVLHCLANEAQYVK